MKSEGAPNKREYPVTADLTSLLFILQLRSPSRGLAGAQF